MVPLFFVHQKFIQTYTKHLFHPTCFFTSCISFSCSFYLMKIKIKKKKLYESRKCNVPFHSYKKCDNICSKINFTLHFAFHPWACLHHASARRYINFGIYFSIWNQKKIANTCHSTKAFRGDLSNFFWEANKKINKRKLTNDYRSYI